MNHPTHPTHPTQDSLVLLAYGEAPRAQSRELESHLATCPTCHAAFLRIERARVAAEWSLPARRRTALRHAPWALLAAAAVVALVLVARPEPPTAGDQPGWRPLATWSATAGYAAGGPLVIEIDAQLTRLEKERSYGFPN